MSGEMMEQVMEELRQQLAESERKRDIAYSALATDEAERDNLREQVLDLQGQIETLKSTLVLPSEVSDSGHRIHAQHAREQRDVLQRQVDALKVTLKYSEADRAILSERVVELKAQLEAAAVTPDGSRSWQCELTEAQERLEAALESWRLTKEDLATTQAVRLKLECRLSSYHKHEQELRDILGWARSFQRCGLTIQPSRLVQLLQKITLHDGTAKLFFEEGGQK